MIKTWREAYEVPNSAEEAKRYDEEPVSGPDIQINDKKKLPTSGIRIEVDDKKMWRDAYAKEVL